MENSLEEGPGSVWCRSDGTLPHLPSAAHFWLTRCLLHASHMCCYAKEHELRLLQFQNFFNVVLIRFSIDFQARVS